MKKLWLIGLNTFTLVVGTYRVSFILRRVRLMLRFLIAYFLWQTVFRFQGRVGYYDASTMQTYLFLGYILAAVFVSTTVDSLADEINSGALSNRLLKPFSIVGFLMGGEVADKVIGLVCSSIEIILLLVLLRPQLQLHGNLGLFLLTTMLGMTLTIIFNFIIACVAFWTNETWGIRFLYLILMEALTGSLVPLDLFPQWLQNLVTFSPFTYFFFYPTKIALGGAVVPRAEVGLGVMAAWLVVGTLIARLLWKKGLKRYAAEGR